MAQQHVIEGTGEELGVYLKQRPRQRFRLVPLAPMEEETAAPKNLFQATPEERKRALDEIAEMNRGLPVLPPEAFERESLYEDRL